ncbi:MAG: sialidase family protein [Armatimonadota bacterium]
MSPHITMRTPGAVLIVMLLLEGWAMAASAPEAVATGVDHRMFIVRLPDGRLMGAFHRTVEGAPEAAARFSSDHGLTWSEPQSLVELPAEGGACSVAEALIDRDGEVHLFLLKWAEVGDATPEETGADTVGNLEGYHGRRLDIWHSRSSDGRSRWSQPRMIWMGYTGALNSVIQLDSGRILLPFSEAQPARSFGDPGEGLVVWTHMGTFASTAIYSDDGGETWQACPERLFAPTPSIVHGYGADEPVVIQLGNGRVWMLMRTQLGHFWQSHSEAGARWTPAHPTDIVSSDSPAGIVRLDDGRIVLLWNNCQRFPYAFGGRHVLHAAISDDEGQSWRGYREVARDPKRFEPPPSRGDFGTAYPFPAVTGDGHVIFCTGQGAGRVQLKRLDPAWLLETEAASDFGPNAEEQWHFFGTRGVALVESDDAASGRLLRIMKPQADWPAAAVWNFPAGRRGEMHLRLRVNEGCGGLRICLTDHFSVPFDMEAWLYSVFNIEVGESGGLLNARLQPGTWHDVQLHWTADAGWCSASVDGQFAGRVEMRRVTPGVSYVRLRATAVETDEAGFLVDTVRVRVAGY